MKFPLFLASPSSSYPQLLSVECAAGAKAHHLDKALPTGFASLSVAQHPLASLSMGVPPLTAGAYLEQATQRTVEPQAVSTLHILRGPDAGRSFPIPRGDTPVGRSHQKDRGIALNDPYLRPEHGTLTLDGSGAHLTFTSAASKPFTRLSLTRSTAHPKNEKAQELRWHEPFMLGSSTCMLTAPQEAPATGTAPTSVFEPVVVNTQAARKLGTLIVMVCVPIVIGVTIAALTGMWFFLLMSLASSALMLIHMLSGRSENRGATRQVQQAGERERERALSLPPAGLYPLCSRNLYGSSSAIVLGQGPRLPFVSGRNVKVSKLKTLENAPHYVPFPTPHLPHEVNLRAEHLHAYLVQLIATYPGEIRVLLHASASGITREVLSCLGVVDRVQLCVNAEQIAEALSNTVPKPQESFLPHAHPTPVAPLYISAGVPHGGGAVFPAGAALCIVHPYNTTHPQNSAHHHDAAPAHVLSRPVLSLRTEGEYLQSVRYVRSGATPQELNPAEGVGQVHPLALDDTCAIADGLSTRRYIDALGVLATNTGTGAGAIEAADAASVHAHSLRLSELGTGALNDELSDAASLTSSSQRVDPLGLLAEEAAARWAANRYSSDVYCLLGSAPGGHLNMGLSEHGPHWIVGGTTGAGKSQLLRSLILTAALRYGPERLGLILVDFKGSAGLGPLAELPQTLSMLSNFDVSAVHRALEFLRADVRQRERDLQALGVNSYLDYLRLCAISGDIPTYPELVIVVDEFRMLVESMPDAMNELMKIATIGRSLGLHLILATQRPQGSISQDIRANIASNICLRVSSGQDSFNLVGHEAAASIPASCPGAGYVRLPDGQNLPFRAPLVDALPSNAAESDVSVQLLTGTGWVPLAFSQQQPNTGAEDYQGEDAQLSRVVHVLKGIHCNDYPLSSGTYAPIPAELPDHSEYEGSLRPFEYALGELEIARYGVRQLGAWGYSSTTAAGSGGEPGSDEASGALALLGTVAERSGIVNSLLVQAAERGEPVMVLTADASLHLRLAPVYTAASGVFDVLVGPHELSHLQFCLQQLRNVSGTIDAAEAGDSGALVLVDGLDSWLELLMRLPQVEGQLYDLLAQGHRYGYRVVFTSALPLRGRFASVAHSTLLSRRFVENDLMRKTVKNYPVPAQGHYAVEGMLNTELIGDEPLEASVLSPVTLGAADLIGRLQAVKPASARHRPLVQFSTGVPLPSQDAVIGIHRGNPGALLCGYRREGTPALLHAPQGTFIAVPGARSSGKSTFLQNLGSLNPQYGVLHIDGGSSPDPERLRQQLQSVPNPERVLLAVDDVPYISAESQQVLLEFGRTFRAGFIAFTPYTRWLSSPILASLSGCSRAVVINPRTIADGEICMLTELPLDLYTDGILPVGRAVVVDAGRATACQLPSGV